jgi:hypothetical protein
MIGGDEDLLFHFKELAITYDYLPRITMAKF